RMESRALQATAYQGIATEWARIDPSAALLHMTEIPVPRLRYLFHFSVVSEWASINPDQALQYLLSENGLQLLSVMPSQFQATVFAKLVISRPEEALSAANVIPGTPGQQLRYLAQMRLVETDLTSAISRIDSMPAGANRRRLVAIVAAIFARRDQTSALQWAMDFDRRGLGTDALLGVVNEIARTDIFAAIDIVVTREDLARRTVDLVSNPGNLELLDESRLQELADLFVSAGSSQQQAVEALLRYWPQRDSQSAWNWVLQQSAHAHRGLFRHVASGFAENGILSSLESVRELPSDVRDEFVTSFASDYAQREPVA